MIVGQRKASSRLMRAARHEHWGGTTWRSYRFLYPSQLLVRFG